MSALVTRLIPAVGSVRAGRRTGQVLPRLIQATSRRPDAEVTALETGADRHGPDALAWTT